MTRRTVLSSTKDSMPSTSATLAMTLPTSGGSKVYRARRKGEDERRMGADIGRGRQSAIN